MVKRDSQLKLILALLIAFTAAWPLLGHAGLLNTRGGGDSPFLLQRLHQLATALADGHFPVRWMADANYGYGYPFFNYYAPLSIYIATIFRFIGFSYVGAVELAQLSGFLLAAWGMFRLAQRWLENDWAALLASVAYTLAPFHLVNVYVRGDSLAEFWAMALYPIVLWLAEAKNGKGMVLFGLAYGALVLSHNVSALIFSPFLLLYLAFIWWRDGLGIKWPAGGLLLGLLLSAWFWLPALAEKSLAQTEPITAGYFHFSNHFRSLDLVQGQWWFNYDVAGGNAFRMGLIQAVLAGLGLLGLLWQWRVRAQAKGWHGLAVVIFWGATVMITPLSRPVWEHLPLLSFAQFPWRFLSVQAVGGALLAGMVAWLPGRRGIVPAGILLLLLAGLGQLQTDHLPLTDSDITAEKLAQYEWFTGNIGSTVSAEYLPYTVQPRPISSDWLTTGQRDRAIILNGQATATIEKRSTIDQRWQIVVDSPSARLALPTLAWPGWQAELDGQELAWQPAESSGLILVEVPAGSHTLTLHLARTPIRLVAELISLFTLLPVLIAGRSHLRPTRRQLLVILPITLLSVGLHLWPEQPLASDNLTWDFEQMGYLHHDPAGVPFSNGAILASYQYSQEAVPAGQELTITLHWQRPIIGTASLALFSPATNRFDQAPPLLVSQQAITSQSHYQITIPPNAPAGLFVPRLTIANARPVMPSGQTRGDLFLRPIRILAKPSPAGAAQLQLNLTQATLSGAMPSRGLANPAFGCGPGAGYLQLQLAWLTPQPMSVNGLVSLRLSDPAGGLLAQCDHQPGYGFLPSSQWPAGQWQADWLGLPLPPTLPDAGPFAVTVRLYHPLTGQALLTRRIGELIWQGDEVVFRPGQISYTLPEQISPMAATFADQIALRGYTLSQQAGQLNLTLYWQALAAGQEDYLRFVHLLDPAGGPPLSQSDGMPRANSYPTSQWAIGEVVSETVTLMVGDVPAGAYQLAIGLYHNTPPYPRLPAIDSNQQFLPDNLVRLPEPIILSQP